MKYSTVLAALVGLVAAQDISMIPECAQPCIEDAVKTSTDCKADDYVCICKNQDALVGGATSCVIEKCGADEATSKVLPATQEFCKEVLAGGSSSAAPSSSAAATSAPASSAPASSAAASSAPASSAAETSAAASGTGYPTASVPAGGNSTASSAPEPTGSTPVTAGAGVVGSVGTLAVLLIGAAVAL